MLDYVERRSEMEGRRGTRLNDYLFEKLAFYMADGIITISDFLKDTVKVFFHQNEMFKLPPLTDFKSFDEVEVSSGFDFILYCGSVGYIEVVELVVEAYRISLVNDKLKLVLVLSGGDHIVKDYEQRYVENPDVFVYDNLSRDELIQKYKAAKALIIPMRPSKQDAARFPQKIAEYVASRNPILSNEFGEIGKYFKHNETAILADGFDVLSYSKRIREIVDGVYDLNRIGEQAYKMGKSIFDQNSYKDSLPNFFRSLLIRQ